MLGKALRKRILARKVSDVKSTYEDRKRIKDRSNLAIRDLTLIAKKMDEKQLEEIFTEEKLTPLLIAILNKRNKRVFEITGMLAYRAYNKLVDELPNDLVNNLSGDIGKTWIYAQLLMDYSDKPLMKQPKKRKTNSKVKLI